MLKILPTPQTRLDAATLHISTLWLAGRMSKAPGTWGSFAALLLAPLLFLPLNLGWRVAVLTLVFPLGSLCASRAERMIGGKDPGCVVIDELWGQWIALLPLTNAHPGWMLLAFALFRLFDITKPWPVKASERWLPGGWGIMIDDGWAGLYALLGVLLCRSLI